MELTSIACSARSFWSVRSSFPSSSSAVGVAPLGRVPAMGSVRNLSASVRWPSVGSSWGSFRFSSDAPSAPVRAEGVEVDVNFDRNSRTLWGTVGDVGHVFGRPNGGVWEGSHGSKSTVSAATVGDYAVSAGLGSGARTGWGAKPLLHSDPVPIQTTACNSSPCGSFEFSACSG